MRTQIKRGITPTLIIGVDEAGRGAWAGPLVAAAVCLKTGKKFKHPLIKDSKKLSPKHRQEVFIYLQPICEIGIGIAEVEEINDWGLQRANVVAVERAVENLARLADVLNFRRDNPRVVPTRPARRASIVIDHIGGFKKYTTLKDNYSLHKFGESKYQEIAAASIVAKVSRDQMMCQLHKKIPHYGFAEHKGYGTRQHWAALVKYSASPAHRQNYHPIVSVTKINSRSHE